MNTDLRRKGKNDFEKKFLSSWIMKFFEKLLKIWEHLAIKFVTTERKMDYLVSEPNYHTITLQSFHRNFISNRNKKTETLTSKPVYVGLSTLELTKISMYEFWYDYVKPKHSEKAKMCYIDTDTLVYA